MRFVRMRQIEICTIGYAFVGSVDKLERRDETCMVDFSLVFDQAIGHDTSDKRWRNAHSHVIHEISGFILYEFQLVLDI